MQQVYDIDTAQDVATQTQAYEAGGIANQFSATTIRSQSGTAAALTANTRANRLSTTGSLANDLFFETDTGWLYYWTGTAWRFLAGVNYGSDTTRIAISVTTADDRATFITTDTAKVWEVSGGTWVDRTPGGGGTVTSFSAAPTGIFDVATPTTTPALSLDNQSANTLLAGPTSGGAATPAFRTLVAADIPAPPSYTAPTLLNSWVNYGGVYANAGYLVHSGIVYLRGMIKNGTAAAGTVLFTLPAGYRPAATLVFAVDSNGAFGEVIVESDGDVVIEVGSNAYVALDNIRFVAGL